ncbi:hypothetical protein [Paracoccus pacificus]|uniref:Uncharacterized protein n=1 Tax=Paracoccus pacificus TaxID=1463598 RepID=A0ABW4RAY7_9RHOB
MLDGASLVAIVGPDCQKIEDLIDEIVVGDGSSDARFLCTTSHPGETLEEVVYFVQQWERDADGAVRQIRL